MESPAGGLRPALPLVVRAGEGSGRLEEALDRVAYQLERLDALRRQVKSAMIYPAVVFGLALVVMIVVVAFDRPGVRRASSTRSPPENPTRDASLPLMTQITVGDLQLRHPPAGTS